MNYLQLVQKLAGLADTAKPAAVTNQTGSSLRLVDWIAQAWEEIQSEREDWRFMWGQLDPVNTVIAQSAYAKPAGVKGIIFSTMAIHGGSGITRPTFMSYESFMGSYRFGTQTGKPAFVTEQPDGKLRFYPIPDEVYQFEFEYYKTPVVLKLVTDVPAIESEFHMAIVYKALGHYAGFEESADTLAVAMNGLSPYETKMANECLPDIGLGGAFV